MKVALVGNPNTGKSSLFNKLTGLNQKVGNYPGVTVDKKTGFCKLADGRRLDIIDLPGAYSLNPAGKDEEIVTEVLTNSQHPNHPDLIVVVADATNLKRNLLLFTQVFDLGLPVILALNMVDLLGRIKMQLDTDGLSTHFGIPVVPINARKGRGLDELKEAVGGVLQKPGFQIFNPLGIKEQLTTDAAKVLGSEPDYRSWLIVNTPNYSLLSPEKQEALEAIRKEQKVIPQRNKVSETITRYRYIDDIIAQFVDAGSGGFLDLTVKFDKIFTHRIWGFVVFFGLLTLMFQAIFSWSAYPMELIELFFTNVSGWVEAFLPPGPIAELLADGVIPGIAGVLVFIPQIAILFGFIALLEESGYMSRVVFLMDRVMRRFGLNGRSVVPLLSGMACAIPAVMATRSIDNWKERLTTIMVTPFTTCAARLPVYTILIALVVPQQKVLGILNMQGLALMGMYVFGIVMVLLAAIVFDRVLKSQRRGYLIMEMPPYKLPHARNVFITIGDKVKTFVFQAGKIILAISILLWVLARFGPGDRRSNALEELQQQAVIEQWDSETLASKEAAVALENSYLGIFGKAIEPAIKPLGYDWKIGIALISSFAAREVFVGTMGTIYAIGNPDNEKSVKQYMAADVNPETGQPRFNLAVAISLLLFYALALQCMSTVAVVYRETKGWKWPAIQFVMMGGLAYVFALVSYQILK